MHRKLGGAGIAVAVMIVAALSFILVNMLGDGAMTNVDTSAGKRFACTVLSVQDGDGPIDCAETDLDGKQVMVRLRGIEARELDNSCQAEVCPSRSGAEAKAELTRLAVGRLQCESFGPSYSRVDSACTNAQGQNISCEMIRSGTAVRWPQYDPDGRLAACVPRGS